MKVNDVVRLKEEGEVVGLRGIVHVIDDGEACLGFNVPALGLVWIDLNELLVVSPHPGEVEAGG